MGHAVATGQVSGSLSVGIGGADFDVTVSALSVARRGHRVSWSVRGVGYTARFGSLDKAARFAAAKLPVVLRHAEAAS